MQVYVVLGTGDRESGSVEWAVKRFWTREAAQIYARALRKHPESDRDRPEGLVGKSRYYPWGVPYGYEEWDGKAEEGIFLVWCRERGAGKEIYNCTVCWFGREVQAKMHCIWANQWVQRNSDGNYDKNPYDPDWVGPTIGVPEYWFEKVPEGRAWR